MLVASPLLIVAPFAADLSLDGAAHLFLEQNCRTLGFEVGRKVFTILEVNSISHFFLPFLLGFPS